MLRSGQGLRTLRHPDIGHRAAWQEPAIGCIPQKAASGGGFRTGLGSKGLVRLVPSAAPAGEKTAPAAGLALRRARWLGEFTARQRVVIDPGIVGRPDNGKNQRRIAPFVEILTRPEPRRGSGS